MSQTGLANKNLDDLNKELEDILAKSSNKNLAKSNGIYEEDEDFPPKDWGNLAKADDLSAKSDDIKVKNSVKDDGEITDGKLKQGFNDAPKRSLDDILVEGAEDALNSEIKESLATDKATEVESKNINVIKTELKPKVGIPIKHAKRVNDFNGSNNIGKYGEEVVHRLLLEDHDISDIVDVSNFPSMQSVDVDFWYLKKGIEEWLEVKTTRTQKGNIFFEIWSSYEVKTLGCNVKTESTKMAYYLVRKNIIYIIDTKAFKRWVKSNYSWLKTKYLIKLTNKRWGGGTYTTVGLNIPDFLLLKTGLLHPIDLNKHPDIFKGLGKI